MLRISIADDEGNTTVVPVLRDEITIGRKEGNTIRLTERNVSRFHAKLIRDASLFFVEDLDSYNGVRINGELIQGRASVKPGDEIQIGDYLLALEDSAAEAKASEPAPASGDETPPSATAAASKSNGVGMAPGREAVEAVASAVKDAQQAAMEAAEGTAVIRASEVRGDAEEADAADQVPEGSVARLVAVGEHYAGQTFTLDRTRVQLGRTEDNDIALEHRSVSRNHVVFEYSGQGYRVKDLGSANGTYINGEEYAEAELKTGDVIEVGYVKLQFVAAGEQAEAPTASDKLRVAAGRSAPKQSLSTWLLLAAVVLLILVAGYVFLGSGGSGSATKPAPDSAAKTPVAAEPAPAAPAAASDPRVLEASALMDKGDYAGAVAVLEAAEEAGSTSPKLGQMLDRAETELRYGESYEAGIEAMEREDWDAAWDHFSSVGEDSRYYARAVKRLPEVKKGYIAYHLEKAKEAETGGERLVALEEYRNVLFLDEQNAAAQQGERRLTRSRRGRKDKGRKGGAKGASAAVAQAVPEGVEAAPQPAPAEAAAAGSPAEGSAEGADTAEAGGEGAEGEDSPRQRALRYYNQGNRLFFQNDYKGAVSSYRKAMRADPTFPDVYRGLGITYAKLKQPDKAARLYQQYIQLAPNRDDVPQFKRFLDDYYRSLGQ